MSKTHIYSKLGVALWNKEEWHWKYSEEYENVTLEEVVKILENLKEDLMPTYNEYMIYVPEPEGHTIYMQKI